MLDLQPLPIPPALRRYSGFLLSALGMRSARGFLAELEPLGIHPKHFGLLNVVDGEPGISQHELGVLLGIDPSSMVARIDELEQMGLAERRTHPEDRRARAIHLTKDGETTLARARKRAGAYHQETFAALSEEEQRQLHELLLKLVDGPA